MKKYFIIFSIFVVGILAFLDAKTRMDELEAVAATTPSQVEMKRDLQKSTGRGIQERNSNPPMEMTYPQSQNNTPKSQNIPQKLNPQFKPNYQPTKNQSP